MKLTFLGTRGNIEATTDRHRRHSSLLVGYRGKSVMIDCGEDWLHKLGEIQTGAVVITHAHPDHAWGLREGAECPVYATDKSWEEIGDYPLSEQVTLAIREPVPIEGMTFEAFPVEHSTRAPAVGYRVTAGRVKIFYAPDLVYIHDRREALSSARLYVGDGATLTRSLVRKQGDHLIGHAPVRTQLTWCRKEEIPRAIFTHCGSEVVEGDERVLGAQLREMAEERGVEAEFAYDGLEIVLR